jgi:hypothetical protein
MTETKTKNETKKYPWIWVLAIVGLVLPPVLYRLLGYPEFSISPASLPMAEWTMLEQFVIVVAAFVIKPLYELITLGLIILLRKQTDVELVAVRRAMWAFLVGETLCAVNFIFYREENILLEFLHSYGMVVSFSLFFYGAMRFLDLRVLKFTAPEDKCALLGLCKDCYKYKETPCKLRRLFMFIVPATALIAFMPLTAKLGEYFVQSKVFGDIAVFGHEFSLQLYETRFLPLVALIFFLLSFLVLWLRKEKGMASAKVLYAMGLGPLLFGWFRFVIFWSYERNSLWADVWEELTEFLFIALVLWLVLQMPEVRRKLKKRFLSR